MALEHFTQFKKGFHVHQYLGILIVFVMMFTYPFLMVDNNWYIKHHDKSTVWAYFRQIFAVILLSSPIVHVEVLLKNRKGTIYEVLFNVGMFGTIFSTIELFIYLLINSSSTSVPAALVQYFIAVFYSAGNFFLTFARLIGTGFLISLVFLAIKYSNSLRIYSYCKFIVTLGFII